MSAGNQPCNEHSHEKAPSNQFAKSDQARDIKCDDNKVRRSDRYTKLFQSNDSQPMSGCDMLITPARPVAPIDVYLDEYDPCTRDSNSKSDFGSRKSTSTAPASRKSVFPQEDTSCSSKSTTKPESMLKNEFEFLKPNLPSSKTKSIDVFVDDDSFSNKGFCGKQIDDFDFISTGDHVGGSQYRKVIQKFSSAHMEF